MKQQAGIGILLALTTAMCWGALPIAMKQVLEVMEPPTVVFYRFLMASIGLGAILAVKGKLPPLRIFRKPRWLVFNKIDLMDKAEAEAKAKAIAEAMGWEDKYYLISAASQVGVKDLCWDVMTFIIENPVVQAEEAKQPEKVEFMWDDYHRQQLEELEAEEDDEDWDDDWDEDDEEGVEFIYKH